LITKNNWKNDFETAIKSSHIKKLPLIENVNTIDQYLDWLNEFLYWIPKEDASDVKLIIRAHGSHAVFLKG
jgi:hypothetical protein